MNSETSFPDWVIHYGDGSKFSSDEGTPYDAPKEDVQVIVVFRQETGWETIHGGDYFYYEPERVSELFTDCDVWSARDHLARADRQCLFFGRMMTNEDFRTFLKETKAQYPFKSALGKNEVRRGVKP